eukprot:2136691-Pyramimonas_sp.AAC.1
MYLGAHLASPRSRSSTCGLGPSWGPLGGRSCGPLETFGPLQDRAGRILPQKGLSWLNDGPAPSGVLGPSWGPLGPKTAPKRASDGPKTATRRPRRPTTAPTRPRRHARQPQEPPR